MINLMICLIICRMLNNLSIYLYPCTSGEIESTIKCLLNTKAVGLDGFSMKVIKYIIKDIYVPQSAAFNSSFVAGVFPVALKHATVVPVLKVVINLILLTIVLYLFYLFYQRSLKSLCIIVLYHLWTAVNYCVITNLLLQDTMTTK